MKSQITPPEAYFEKVEELNRDFAVFHDVMNPTQASSKLFLGLINNLSKDLNKKYVLDLGCGCGVLSIALARSGAEVVAVDIDENAVENTKFNIEMEDIKVKEKITVLLSNLFLGLKNQKFDFIFFNNPTFEGDPIYIGTTISTFAGINFQTNKKALLGIPGFLNPHGLAHFLVIESKSKISKMWTQEHLKENLPEGYSCKKAIKEVTFDEKLGLGYCIYEVYSE